DATADKLPQDRVVRDDLGVGERLDPAQEREQALRLDVVGRVVLDLQQERLGERAQHGQFVKQRRVKHHIRVFLVGEDPAVLPGADARPARQCLLCAVSACSGVTDQAAQQANVGGGHTVV